MTDAKLSKLVEFYKRRLDALSFSDSDSDSDFDRGAYIAFSIAMIKTREIVWEILERQLTLEE